MSRTVQAFGVDVAALRRLVGSSSPTLIGGLGPDARAIVSGSVPQNPVAAVHALRELCAALGRRLSNTTLAPASAYLLERVDLAMDADGVSPEFRLQRVVYRGAPVAIPPAPDYPFVGYVEWDELAPALTRLPASTDELVDDALREMEGWFDILRIGHRGIVGFYY